MKKTNEDLENEVWVRHPIGIMVSNLGRVETARKGKWYGSKNSTPYLQVKWLGKAHSVHRLICETFHPNEDNLPTVNHIDENKQNNRADNLEWCSYSYNTNYGTAQERRAEKLSIPILQLNKETLEVVKEWKSSHQAAREGGFLQTNITKCLKGKYKTCGGYVWRYAEGVRKAIS